MAEPVRAATGWAGWWLPANYARHGAAIDLLFDWVLWITVAAVVIVHVLLVGFAIRYRHGAAPGRRRMIQASARWEVIWTLIPAIILGGLALASARVWDAYRYTGDDADVANILVIGQQFKWNIIYAGKDGKFGRYLVFPKPTDRVWPHRPQDTHYQFMGVPGPSSLPYAQATAAIDAFVSQEEREFQLGKDFSDLAGADDDFEDALGRTLYLPVNRPVKISVMSRDVIHDFYLPNFRVQVYAVPGMVNSVTFTPTQTTAEIEAASRRQYTLDELEAAIGTQEYHLATGGQRVTSELLKQLKSAGDSSVMAYKRARLEVICNQLCGVGHSLMKTDIVILPEAEYHRRFESQ
jgi:cytochrome c oxidase subunit 2